MLEINSYSIVLICDFLEQNVYHTRYKNVYVIVINSLISYAILL